MIRVISLGAGVQSSTVALMASRGLFVELPQRAIFADTQAEPGLVYDWLWWLANNLPFPVDVITAGSLEEDTLRLRTTRDGLRKYWKSYIPSFTFHPEKGKGMSRRKCTADYKIRPLIKAQRSLIDPKVLREWYKEFRRVQGPPPAGLTKKELRHWKCYHRPEGIPTPLVETWIGISTDEAHRMKTSSEPWSVNRYPLIEAGMSRTDCLRWMADNGYPQPPRSACTFCPYHSDAEWLRLKRESPAEFQNAVIFEKRAQELAAQCKGTWGVPFLHASRQPLDQVVFKEGDDKDGFGNECEGGCRL
jgi:hypothetical protein